MTGFLLLAGLGLGMYLHRGETEQNRSRKDGPKV